MSHYNAQGVADARILHAISTVKKTHGIVLEVVSDTALRKFGSNTDADTGAFETVWTGGGDETYQTTNSIDTLSSSNAADTQTIKLNGFTMSGSGLLTRVVQEVVVDGQNKVLLGTPLARVERGFNISATDLLGDIYVYRDTTLTAGVPTDLAFNHLVIEAIYQQSHKCAFSTDQNEFFFITSFGATTLQGNNAHADFSLETRKIEAVGLVFRNQLLMSASRDGADVDRHLDPVIIVPNNYDVRMRAESDVNNIGVSADIGGYYFKINNYISPDA